MTRNPEKVSEETNGEVPQLKIISREELNQLQLEQINQKLDYLINNLIEVTTEEKKE